MPQGETFWNPYRWVCASDQPIQRAAPNYHHQLCDRLGRIWCELQALTPLLVGDGCKEIGFVKHKTTKRPFIPGTSLKGSIRSLAELVGNAAVPSDKDRADRAHGASEAAKGEGTDWQLDIVGRSFGYLEGGKTFSGLVRFSDAELVGDAVPQPLSFRVAGGQPDPNHRPFYPDNQRRKFYHHQPGTTGLTPPHAGIREDQKRTVRPLPAGTTFAFVVDFLNLRDEELNLLLYCLVLEDEVTVTLSAAALGPDAQTPATFAGPLRHKLGGCKPQGAGSCHIRITELLLRSDPAARYRGATGQLERILTGEPLADELQQRTSPFRARTDVTMQELRAMLIYSQSDPRTTMNYPSYQWFKDAGSATPLRPTL